MTQPEERMIDKIRKLMDRAAHPNTPEPEREACLARADDMMTKYAIDEALLQASRSKEDRERPERRDVVFYEPSDPLAGQLDQILQNLASLADVAIARVSYGKHAAVGYSADIDYLEMLFNTVRLQFQARMYPKWDNSLSLDANVYNFKVAGYRWYDIWREGALKNEGPMPFPAPPNDGGKMIRAYKRHAKAIGDSRPITTQRFEAYRASYAAGFVTTIAERVEQMTRSRRGSESSAGSGAEVALRDRRADVREAFYTEFPGLRPKTDAELRAEAEAHRQRREQEAREHAAWYASLTPAQRDAYDRKQEREAAANERAWNRYYAKNRRDHDGYAAGSRAAKQTDLSGGRNNLGQTRGIER